MAQRISRAKQQIKARRQPRSSLPPEPERAERLRVVLHVLYLIFNEGYTATSGPDLQRAELTARGDPARPGRARGCCPTTARSAGLLALMLLTDARRAGAHATRRQPGPARRAGPQPLGAGRRSTRASR